jgi:hypothetical protein
MGPSSPFKIRNIIAEIQYLLLSFFTSAELLQRSLTGFRDPPCLEDSANPDADVGRHDVHEAKPGQAFELVDIQLNTGKCAFYGKRCAYAGTKSAVS